MGSSCTRRHFLLSICILQLLFIIERQTIDFLGYMWAPILVNFFHIIFVIFGFFGAYTFRIKYLVTYGIWNFLWIGWNVFLICFYLNVGELNRDSDILNLGTGSVSWFEVNGYGCKPTYPTNITSEDPYRPVRPERVDDCLLDYFIVEIIHSGLHCLLAFLGLIAAICIGRIFIDEDDSFDFMGGDAKSPQHTAVHPMYVSYTSIPTSVSANSTANNRHHKALNNNNNGGTLEPLHTGGGDNGTLVLQKINPSLCSSSTNTLLPPYKKSQSQVHLHEPTVMAAAAAAAAAAHHNNINAQSNNAINQMLRNKSTSSFTNRSFAQDVNLNSSFDDFGGDATNTRRYLISQQQRNFGINNPFVEHFHRENASYNSDFDSATESAHEMSPFLENQSPAPRLPARPDPNTQYNFRHNQVNPMPLVHQNGGDYIPEEVTGDERRRRYYEPRNVGGAYNNFKPATGDDNQQRYIMPHHYVARSPNLSRSSRRRYEQHGRPQHYQPQQPAGNFFDQVRDAPPGYDDQITPMHRAKSQDRLTHRSRRSSNNRNRDSQRPRSFCSNLPPYVHE